MALLLVFLADCGVISLNLEENTLSWFRLLQPITSILMDIQKRPYVSQDKFYNALQFYTILLDAVVGNGKEINEKHSSAIISCLNCSFEFLEFIFQKSLMDIKGSDDIINFQILLNLLQTLSSVITFKEMFVKLLPSFLINYNHIPAHFLSKKIIIILLYEISNNQLHDKKFSNKPHLNPFRELSLNFLAKILAESVINDLLKTVFVNEMEKEDWQKFVALYINKFWKTASVTANFLSLSVQKDLILGLFQLAEDVFDGGSKTTYASTISCIEILIPKLGLSNMHIVEKLLNVAYKACLELQGCEAYRPAIESFIKTVFQPFMLNEICFDILNKYIKCFQNISENSLGIFYMVIKQFCSTFPLAHLYKMNFNYIPLIIHSLTYGPIHQRSQKILEDSIASISEQDDYFFQELKNYDKPSVFVRVTAIVYLLNNLYKKSTESEEIALHIINALLSLDENTRASKSSTFANSYNHRVRNRIWQCILLLQPNVLSESENIKFFKKICELLEFDNQQPSIRYLQEWLILKIINLNKYLVRDFISVLEKSLEKRPGFIVSLLSVLIHLIIHDFLLSEDQVSKCFPVLISYCMAQNFAVRLYSRLAVAKLFSACENNNFSNLVQKYDFIHNLSLPQVSEDSLLEKGNIYKNLIKLQEEFYFSVFHPIKHFTLETIFFELPRLSNLAPEEWIKAGYFKECLSSDFQLIANFNSDNCLKNSYVLSWNAKSNDEPLVENNSYDYNFQKKICPVKSEIYDCIPDAAFESKPKQSDLIVIASLIDKIPNLGGLCRTCEIFGVEQFIIGSLKYKEDKTFQNLAVSSDKWLSIKEVKPYHLKEYLLSLKEEGYTLIGAEQTDDSYKLSNYVFPKKSALILGHEKEGMPVNLIQVLDACVEIPQQGIIRSLNVHVSGAIFIWEYARQQIRH